MEPCKEGALEREEKMSNVHILHVHTYVSIYLSADMQAPCVAYVCVCIFIHICMYRVHRAHPNKYTPDVPISSSVRKSERNEIAFEDIGHTKVYCF